MILEAQLCALVLDFEGQIGLGKSLKGSGNHHYTSVVAVAGTSLALLQHLQNLTGFGDVNPTPYKPESGAPCYTWRLTVDETRKRLCEIEPYLVLKKEQARLLGQALKIIRPFESFKRLTMQERSELYTASEWNELESIYQELRTLNAKPLTRYNPSEQESFLNALRRRGVPR